MASEHDSPKPRVSVETIPIGMMNVADLAIARGPVTGDSGERLSPGPSPVIDVALDDADAPATGARPSRPSGRPPAPRMTPIEPHALRAATTPAVDDDVDAFLAPAAPSKALPIVGGLVLVAGIFGGIFAYTRTRTPAPPATTTAATTAPEAPKPPPTLTATVPAPEAIAPTAAAAPTTTAPTEPPKAAPAVPATSPQKATPKATATAAAPTTATPPATAAPKPKPKGKDEDDPWK